MIGKRLLWVGTLVATWQFLGCSRISEPFEPTASAIGTVTYQLAHRKIFHYSIIPGGVYSRDELTRARATDPVVAQHYADFGPDARVIRLAQDQLVYISYRKADKVFWTKKKHRVCQGEAMLSDGKNNLARSRCGNRMSSIPKLPTANRDPAESVLNTPEINPAATSMGSGAGPLGAAILPRSQDIFVPPFGDSVAETRAGDSMNRASTGAGKGSSAISAFSPSTLPYFGAGPISAPSALLNATGASSSPASGSSTTGGVTTAPGGGVTTSALAVPEPAVALLCLTGILLLCALRGREMPGS